MYGQYVDIKGTNMNGNSRTVRAFSKQQVFVLTGMLDREGYRNIELDFDICDSLV